jgi:hypothetical protein
MEWHGEKMLPRGLPELVYEVAPNWILPNLKVIVHPKKAKRGSEYGCVGWHDNWWRIDLYPTVILHGAKINGPKFAVISFWYWQEFLRIMLHEIGHIVTYPKSLKPYDRRYRQDWNYYEHVEWMADVWCEATKDKIATRDPRLGQPEGWIGGLAGIYLRRHIDLGKANSNSSCYFSLSRIINYRGYRCGGQQTLTHVVSSFVRDYLHLNFYDIPRCARILRRHVKRILPELGITRYYIDSNNRKHLFFSYGESMVVINELRRYVLEKNLMDLLYKESSRHEKHVEAMSQLLKYGKKKLAACKKGHHFQYQQLVKSLI